MSEFIADFRRRDSADSGTSPGCSTAPQKNVLVSYVTAPIRMGPDFNRFMFSNAGIARSMIKVLVEMGCVVDLIDWNCMDFESGKRYDLFIGHAGANWEYLSRNIVGDAVKIYFATGIYWKQFNRREMQRFDELERRRGVRLAYDRLIESSEEYACHDADGIICLGNKHALESYKQFPICVNLNSACFEDNRGDPTAKDFESGRRHFLYLGSGGNVHKGLDLLVEAFTQLDADLWCAGRIEPDFIRVYRDELELNPNIHLVGWVNLRSPRFYELMNRCNCTIFASCAEGSPGGVIECMNQGVIPIVSRDANIDVGEFGILLQDDSVEEIVRVVREVMAKPAQWHYAHSIRTRETVLTDYSPQTFERNLRAGIEQVIENSQQTRAKRQKAAFQAEVNFTYYWERYRDSLGALLRGAALLKSRRRNDQAAQLWQRALVVEPACVSAMCELGAYYAEKREFRKAREIAERALEYSPLDRQCLAILRQTENVVNCCTEPAKNR